MSGPGDKPDELLAENARLRDDVSKLQNEERISAIALMNADEMVCKLEADLRAVAMAANRASELTFSLPIPWARDVYEAVAPALSRPGVREVLNG